MLGISSLPCRDSRARRLTNVDNSAISSNSPESPGDDARLTQAVESFLGKLKQGHNPSPEEYLDRYADIAKELKSCLDGLVFVHCVAPRLSSSSDADLLAEGAERMRTEMSEQKLIRSIRSICGTVQTRDDINALLLQRINAAPVAHQAICERHA